MFFVTEFVIAIASQEFKKKLLNFHDDFLHISKIENSWDVKNILHKKICYNL